MKNRNWWIVPDAFPPLAGGILLTLLFYWVWGMEAAVFPALLVLFICWFFRNPERRADAQADDVLSPADGVVLAVEETREDRYLQGQALKISIFLNVFNVHVNRSPIAGVVEYTYYQPGKFLPAFKGHASQLNERNYIGIRSAHDPSQAVLVVQITGFVARRIVCWVKTGERLLQGERFGLIKFGSCTEVYLPVGSTVLVKKGQKVRGGETIIGRLRHE